MSMGGSCPALVPPTPSACCCTFRERAEYLQGTPGYSPPHPRCGISPWVSAEGSWLTWLCRSGVGPGAAPCVPDEHTSCLQLEDTSRC